VSTDFGYTAAPVTSNRVDLIRLFIGDTNKDNALMTDEEICLVLGIQAINTYAAAACADIIAAKFARKVTVSIGDTKIENEGKFKQYMKLADRLRAGGPGDLPGGDGSGAVNAQMFVGGLSKSQRNDFFSDSDRIQPNFNLGKDDHPNTRDNVDENDFNRCN
jgi:hypothetical protein